MSRIPRAKEDAVTFSQAEPTMSNNNKKVTILIARALKMKFLRNLQFLRSGGLAAKAQDLASSHRLFPRTGILLGALMSTFGAISFYGSGWAFIASEMTILVSTDLGVSLPQTNPHFATRVLHEMIEKGARHVKKKRQGFPPKVLRRSGSDTNLDRGS